MTASVIYRRSQPFILCRRRLCPPTFPECTPAAPSPEAKHMWCIAQQNTRLILAMHSLEETSLEPFLQNPRFWSPKIHMLWDMEKDSIFGQKTIQLYLQPNHMVETILQGFDHGNLSHSFHSNYGSYYGNPTVLRYPCALNIIFHIHSLYYVFGNIQISGPLYRPWV